MPYYCVNITVYCTVLQHSYLLVHRKHTTPPPRPWLFRNLKKPSSARFLSSPVNTGARRRRANVLSLRRGQLRWDHRTLDMFGKEKCLKTSPIKQYCRRLRCFLVFLADQESGLAVLLDIVTSLHSLLSPYSGWSLYS